MNLKVLFLVIELDNFILTFYLQYSARQIGMREMSQRGNSRAPMPAYGGYPDYGLTPNRPYRMAPMQPVASYGMMSPGDYTQASMLGSGSALFNSSRSYNGQATVSQTL